MEAFLSAAFGAFCGAVLGVVFNFLWKLYFENRIKFYHKKCDAVFVIPNIKKTDISCLFQTDSTPVLAPKKIEFVPIRVGNELYWGLNFGSRADFVCADYLCNSSGYIYLTKQGKKRMKKGN